MDGIEGGRARARTHNLARSGRLYVPAVRFDARHYTVQHGGARRGLGLAAAAGPAVHGLRRLWRSAGSVSSSSRTEQTRGGAGRLRSRAAACVGRCFARSGCTRSLPPTHLARLLPTRRTLPPRVRLSVGPPASLARSLALARQAEEIVQFHVGELVVSLQKERLSASAHEVVLYATNMGAIGALLPVKSRDDIDFLKHLEMHLRQEAPPLCGRDHIFFRSAFFPVKVRAHSRPRARRCVLKVGGGRVADVAFPNMASRPFPRLVRRTRPTATCASSTARCRSRCSRASPRSSTARRARS